MKPLNQLNNVERARIIFDLFPAYREGITERILKDVEHLEKHQEKIKEQWDNCLLSYELWFKIGQDLKGAIQDNHKTIHKKSGVFADQLFDMWNAMFSANSLVEFARDTQFKTPNKETLNFKKMAEILFT